MNCHRIEGVISDLARDQMVEASVRDEALEHCKVCASCRRTQADQRALTSALRGLADTWQSIDAPETILDGLTSTLRRQATMPGLSRRLGRWQYAASAVAAVLLIFSVIATARWYLKPVITTKSEPEVVRANVNAEDTSAPPVVPIIRPENVKKTSSSEAVASKRRGSRFPAAGPEKRDVPQILSTATVVNYGGNEIATEFLPLGYGNALSLQDGGQIVRVEVPRSTLVSFGLPVNMDRVGQRVKADLLLGVDGSARAIRFVQ